MNTDPPGTRGLPAEAPATARPPRHPGSGNSDTARYQRGLQAYASQFHIPPDQVPAWFANTVGDRFGEEAIQSAANAWTDDELSLRDRSLVVYSVLDTAPAPVSRCPADTPLAWESDTAFLVLDKRSSQVVRCRVGSNQTESVGHVDQEWSVVPRYGT